MRIRLAFVGGLVVGLLLVFMTGSVLAFDPKVGQASAKIDKYPNVEQRRA